MGDDIAAEDCLLDFFHLVMVGHFCCNGQSMLKYILVVQTSSAAVEEYSAGIQD